MALVQRVSSSEVFCSVLSSVSLEAVQAPTGRGIALAARGRHRTRREARASAARAPRLLVSAYILLTVKRSSFLEVHQQRDLLELQRMIVDQLKNSSISKSYDRNKWRTRGAHASRQLRRAAQRLASSGWPLLVSTITLRNSSEFFS